MRVAAYSDVEYRRDGDSLYAPESFVVFMCRLAKFVDHLTLVGRLAPDEGRSHYRVPEGVGFLGLPHYAQLSRPWTAVGAMARSLRRFWRLLGEVDVVWLLGPHPLAVLFVLLAALRRKRVVLGVRQDFPSHMRTRHPGNRAILGAALVLEGIWRLLGRAYPLVAVGPDLARRYRGGEVLPIVISLVDEEHITSREQALTRSYDGELSVLSVGRLDPEKNPLLLAEVFARLRDQDPRYRLVVCGDGTMKDELAGALRAAGVEEHAQLLGYVSLDDGLRDLYRSSHVFLHVSWTEGVPQVLFESFAAGLPVVATAVGGVPELAEGRSVLIPPGDADAATEATRRVVSDPDLRAELVDAGLDCVRLFSLDSEAQRVTALFAGNAASEL
ncbi:MAG: glycosyltransferase family 4 protein [Thermoleophilaceae bacterium]|nr:glycosyltransferase family 4 protein [Thermoleophilaceae bacterium]